MKQAIIIFSHDLQKRKGILKQCLDSIHTDYPVVVFLSFGIVPKWLVKKCRVMCGTNGYNGIKKVYDLTDYDEFFCMHDTCQVKDNALWDVLFKQHKGKSVSIANRFGMGIGKFLRSTLDKITIFDAKDKIDSYHAYEETLPEHYQQIEDYITLCPEFTDAYGTEEFKWGRANHRLECPYLIKWKGNWNLDMCVNGGVESYDE